MNRKAISINEASANDPEVKMMVDRITSGKVIASAPCESMYIPWTEQEKSDLAVGIKEMFG